MNAPLCADPLILQKSIDLVNALTDRPNMCTFTLSRVSKLPHGEALNWCNVEFIHRNVSLSVYPMPSPDGPWTDKEGTRFCYVCSFMSPRDRCAVVEHSIDNVDAIAEHFKVSHKG